MKDKLMKALESEGYIIMNESKVTIDGKKYDSYVLTKEDAYFSTGLVPETITEWAEKKGTSFEELLEDVMKMLDTIIYMGPEKAKAMTKMLEEQLSETVNDEQVKGDNKIVKFPGLSA